MNKMMTTHELELYATVAPDLYVIWGLGGTLKTHAPELKSKFSEQCIQTAIKMAGYENEPSITDYVRYYVQDAERDYDTSRQRTKRIATLFHINEEELFQQYYADIITKHVLVSGGMYREVVDQGVLAAFEASTSDSGDKVARIEHRLLTNAPTQWALFWLGRMGIKQYFNQDYIFGLDAVQDLQNAEKMNLTRKSQNIDALEKIMEGIHVSRHDKVIVIDNDPAYLSAFKKHYPAVQTFLCLEFENDKRQNLGKHHIRGHKVTDKIATFMKEILEKDIRLRTGPHRVKSLEKTI